MHRLLTCYYSSHYTYVHKCGITYKVETILLFKFWYFDRYNEFIQINTNLIITFCASLYFFGFFFLYSSVLYGAFYEKAKSTESHTFKSMQTAGNKFFSLPLCISSIISCITYSSYICYDIFKVCVSYKKKETCTAVLLSHSSRLCWEYNMRAEYPG